MKTTLIGALLVALYLVLAIRTPAGISPFGNRTDTLAFYCGARVVAAGADPYRAEPLRTCEHSAQRAVGIDPIANLVVPAPLPGYALALLRPLANLSYPVALAVWFGILAAAVAITVVLMWRMTGLPRLPLAVAFFGADAYASISLGQIVPLVVLAIVAAATAARTGNPRRAALFAGCALVEPHLGLPIVLALALFVPRTRLILASIVLGLGILSVASLGLERNIEYFTAALPAQARGEGLEFHRQYSLSALLSVMGVPARVALRAGSLSYVGALVAGLALARRARATFDEPAMIVIVPAAIVLVGGAYAHIAQMAAALPLGCVLVARTTGVSRRVAIAATVCLAIPWQTLASEPTIAALFPATPSIDPVPLLARVSAGSRLASDAWDAWNATIANRDHRTTLEVLLGKLPTWFGLVALAVLATLPATTKESVERRGTGYENTTTRTTPRARSLRSN